MAQWISQSECSSVTSASRNRTAYLAPILSRVVSSIREYFEASPEGEEVTLAVLRAIGRQALDEIRGHRTFSRVKQDLGLLVAISLVDLFGAGSVDTYRRSDGRSVSTRRTNGPVASWSRSYTPHRVRHGVCQAPRILLDAVVLRNFVCGDEDALSVDALAEVKGQHPVSVADGALAELAAALLRGAVPAAAWAAKIRAFDAILDPLFPVAPGGKELAALWGAHPTIGLDLGEMQAYYRAAWSLLRKVRSAHDLSSPQVFHSPSGRAYEIRLDRDHVESVLNGAGQRWADWASRTGEIIRDIRTEGDTVSERDLRELTRNNLMLDMGAADAAKLDLVVHVLARRGLEAGKKTTPYAPKGKPNDALDLDLLFGIPLPAWVCTQDMRLHRLVHSTASPDRLAVMTPDELLERLAAEG